MRVTLCWIVNHYYPLGGDFLAPQFLDYCAAKRCGHGSNGLSANWDNLTKEANFEILFTHAIRY